MIDQRSFRDALSAFATGVVIVTTRTPDGRDAGVTASSFNSVSLDPPMVLWSLGRSSSNFSAFQSADHFAVHVLAAHQDDLSRRFSTRGIDRFEGLAIQRGIGGVPLLDECSTRFECSTIHRYEGGDHLIFVGKLETLSHTLQPPLIFHGGRYAMAVPHSGPRPPEVQAGAPVSETEFNYLLWRAFFQSRRLPRERRQSVGWSDQDSAILQMALRRDGSTIQEIDEMVSFAGLSCSADDALAIETRGLVAVDRPIGPDAGLTVTPSARERLMELLALGRSVEAAAVDTLDPSEIYVLKRLLREVIRNTQPGKADPDPV